MADSEIYVAGAREGIFLNPRQGPRSSQPATPISVCGENEIQARPITSSPGVRLAPPLPAFRTFSTRVLHRSLFRDCGSVRRASKPADGKFASQCASPVRAVVAYLSASLNTGWDLLFRCVTGTSVTGFCCLSSPVTGGDFPVGKTLNKGPLERAFRSQRQAVGSGNSSPEVMRIGRWSELPALPSAQVRFVSHANRGLIL
jgi:hypothetical protein